MNKLTCSLALAALTSTAALTAAGPAVAAPPPLSPRPPAASAHVVVRGTGPDLDALTRTIVRVGGKVTRRLPLIDGVAAVVPASDLAALRGAAHVREVSPDATVTLAGTGYTPQNDPNSLLSLGSNTGSRQLWGKGATGKGVDVALVDSGVAPVLGINKTQLVEGPDLTPESQNPQTAHLDTYGHGTHLAGIIAGHDPAVTDVTKAENDNSDFLGVAPDARIVSVKVADYHGNSDVSQVIAGIDWVVQHAHDNGLNIRVLNLSFGSDSAQAYTSDPLAYAAEQAWKQGIVVVTSAGNSGANSGRLTDPATDPFVLAVGADDTQGSTSFGDDVIPAFSARGDGTRNPDLVAPGVHIPSLRVPGSWVDTQYGGTAAVGTRFLRGSGTSQAAAYISGVAALLLQANPTLTPDELKASLTRNASALPAADLRAQGAGEVQLRSYTPAFGARQSFVASTGTGTLQGSRGSTHLVLTTAAGNVPLSGEKDLFGASVDTAGLARDEAAGTAWTGGTFNGTGWTSNGFASSSWASSSWASSSWASSSWASTSWASSSWASSSWASSSWASSSWASSCWASSSWASSSWADANWASSTWA